MSYVRIGSKLVGDDQPCFVIAEIGINHNGDVDLAKRLISVALAAGCEMRLSSKNGQSMSFTLPKLAKPRENPFSPHRMAISSTAWNSSRKSLEESSTFSVPNL